MEHSDLTDVPILEHRLESRVLFFFVLLCYIFIVELRLEVEDLGITASRFWCLSWNGKPLERRPGQSVWGRLDGAHLSKGSALVMVDSLCETLGYVALFEAAWHVFVLGAFLIFILILIFVFVLLVFLFFLLLTMFEVLHILEVPM
jgi:hypothetical protein